jgi:hypothetical protein
MKRAVLLALAILSAASTPALAQDKPVVTDNRPAIVKDMVEVARAAAAAGSPTPFRAPVGAGGRQLTAAYLIAANRQRTAYAALLTALEAARLDKQMGSAPQSNGGTSLAMKGLAPKILGVAVERGALTREVSGTSLTFRLNPVGLVKALGGAGLTELNDDYAIDAAQRLGARFSLAATFDVSKGSDPGVFTGNDQQFASWSARYAFINRRDPASQEYAAEWAKLLSPATAPYRASVGELNDALGRWAAYETWEKALLTAIATRVETLPFKSGPELQAALKTFSTVLTDDLKKLEALPPPAEVVTALDAYVAQLAKVQSSIDDIYFLAGKGPLLTLDVTDTRDKDLPDLYTITGVFEAGLGPARRTDLTINAAFSTYTRKPAGVDHALKSIDVTTELERPLGRGLPAPTLTVAARYSYLPHNTVAQAATAAGTAAAAVGAAPEGHIGVLQAKVTIPMKSGMKVPISVTASNRTELIKEKDVRGSIGLTLDLDTLMQLLPGAGR